MLGFTPKGKTKQAALGVAQNLEPSENWLKNKRCKVPHDGIIDAFLIAHYYRNGQREEKYCFVLSIGAPCGKATLRASLH